MLRQRNLLDQSSPTDAGLPRIFPGMGPATFDALFGDLVADAPPVPSTAWEVETETIEAHHLAGLAVGRLVHVEVPHRVRDRLRAGALMEMNLSDIAAHASERALRRLESIGVRYVVIKGPGISALSGGTVARPFSDIDVLVEEADFARALRTLRDEGFSERTVSQPTWEYFNRHCREAVNLRSELGGSIDLHHRVSPWLWSASIDFEGLVARSHRIDCAGVSLPVVSPVDNLLICALHIVSDHGEPGVSLRPWRDLVLLCRRCEVGEVTAEAERAELVGWLAWILENLPDEVRPAELYDRLRAADGYIPARRRLEHLLPPHVGSSHLVGQALRLPVGNAAMFLAGMVVPSRRFLRGHYPEGGRYLRWWRDSTTGLRSAGQD